MLLGLWTCITHIISPVGIVAGIWQVSAGFILVVIEVLLLLLLIPLTASTRQAPFLCMFLDFVESFARVVDARPVWQKTALYLV